MNQKTESETKSETESETEREQSNEEQDTYDKVKMMMMMIMMMKNWNIKRNAERQSESIVEQYEVLSIKLMIPSYNHHLIFNRRCEHISYDGIQTGCRRLDTDCAGS